MQSRCVNAIANAVESSTPNATRPAVRPASAAPMPPGTGRRPGERRRGQVDEEELREGQIDAVRVAHRAEREREDRLGREAPAEELDALAPVSRDRPEAGQPVADRRHDPSAQRRNRHDARRRRAMSTAKISTTVSLDGTMPPSELVSRSTSTKASSTRTSTIWMTVCEMSSTAPAATASARGAPIFWRKRTLIAMRPAELGTVRLMNLIAASRTTHGRRASGVATAPRSATACVTNVVCARTSAEGDPREVRLRELVPDRPEPDRRELGDQQVGREPDRRGHQEVAEAEAAERRDLRQRRPGHLGRGGP